MNLEGLFKHCGGVSDLVRGVDEPRMTTDTPVREYPIHEVVSGPLTRQTKLQLRLENDEPKCGKCKHWGGDAGVPLAPCMLPPVTYDPSGYSALSVKYTTDLSVCSKWEPKE